MWIPFNEVNDILLPMSAFSIPSAPIGAVLCNGGTAGRLYRRWLEPVTGLPAEVLPSTSPANAAWSAERLAGRWRAALLAALGA